MHNLKKKFNKFSRKPKAFKKLVKRKRILKKIESGLHRRKAKEARLKLYGIASIMISFTFLIGLLYSIISSGYSAFLQTQIKLPVTFSQELVQNSDYGKIIRNSLASPERSTLISRGAKYELQKLLENNPEYIGKTKEIWLPASSSVDMHMKGHSNQISETEAKWLDSLQQENLVRKAFNLSFFTSGDSREAELAGILGSLTGSILIIISCMVFAFPIGVMAAIYLEEFAPKNKLTAFIEVNIQNLAAVPSIIFGLVGLVIYLHIIGIPRSAPLAGGLTLALMALPIIVISTRTSIRAIPQSIRDGATALGASKLQVTLHHVLPLAMPGIMTGTILSISRVLGETSPLLMIGMVAFIVDIPHSFIDAATAMPVQIYLWAENPETGFAEKTSASIIILLLLLITINMVAVFFRKKFETRW